MCVSRLRWKGSGVLGLPTAPRGTPLAPRPSARRCMRYALLHPGAGQAIFSVLICFLWRACTSRLGWPAGPPRSALCAASQTPKLLDLVRALAGHQCNTATPSAFPGGNPGCLASTPA